MSKKTGPSEDALRKYVESDPQRKQQFGDPWADIAKAVSVQKQIYKPFYTWSNPGVGLAREFAVTRAFVARRRKSQSRITTASVGFGMSDAPTLETAAVLHRSHLQIAGRSGA